METDTGDYKEMKLRIVNRTHMSHGQPYYVIQYKRFGKWRDRPGAYGNQAGAEYAVGDILQRDVVVRTYE